LCTIAWFWVPMSEMYGIYQHFKRWEFPAWADSIAIPFFYISVMAFIGWLVLAILIWFVVLRKSALPVRIWTWPSSRPVANIVLSMIAAVSLATTALLIWKALRYGPFVEIPGLLLWAYATLIARAAALSHSTRRELSEL
ncbi:MAG TPA: hypothetical protein VFQ69_04450, partial [Rhizomicrobium sp.]|nr:hypothetical protein [Rhizomicrobium sp.]